MRAAFLVLAACGRFGFGSSGDAGLADTATDAGTDAAAVTYRDAVLADMPVAYWRLGDAGNDAADELGNLAGIYVGTCSHQVAGALAADSDTATQFDGTTCYIQLPDDPRIQFFGVAPFSIEVWVNELDAAAYYHYFTREDRTSPTGGAPNDGYAFLQYQGFVYLERVAGSQKSQTEPHAVITAGQFVHLVATFDGATEQLFVDGAQVGAGADATLIPTFAFSPLVGRQPVNAFFAGVMDELAIYDHVLAPARIALHHTIGMLGPQ